MNKLKWVENSHFENHSHEKWNNKKIKKKKIGKVLMIIFRDSRNFPFRSDFFCVSNSLVIKCDALRRSSRELRNCGCEVYLRRSFRAQESKFNLDRRSLMIPRNPRHNL